MLRIKPSTSHIQGSSLPPSHIPGQNERILNTLYSREAKVLTWVLCSEHSVAKPGQYQIFLPYLTIKPHKLISFESGGKDQRDYKLLSFPGKRMRMRFGPCGLSLWLGWQNSLLQVLGVSIAVPLRGLGFSEWLGLPSFDKFSVVWS